jgi:DNA-binding response OmpR family regulator
MQKHKRALVIDNDPEVHQLLTRHISAKGWDVVAVSRGNTAKELCTSGMFDLILTDAELSGGTILRKPLDLTAVDALLAR